jgi:hypothetical protein
MISSAIKIKTYVSVSYNKYLNLHGKTTEFFSRVFPDSERNWALFRSLEKESPLHNESVAHSLL